MQIIIICESFHHLGVRTDFFIGMGKPIQEGCGDGGEGEVVEGDDGDFLLKLFEGLQVLGGFRQVVENVSSQLGLFLAVAGAVAEDGEYAVHELEVSQAHFLHPIGLVSDVSEYFEDGLSDE